MASLQEYISAQRKQQRNKKNFLHENVKHLKILEKEKKTAASNNTKSVSGRKPTLVRKGHPSIGVVKVDQTSKHHSRDTSNLQLPTSTHSSTTYSIKSSPGTNLVVKNQGCQTEGSAEVTEDLLKLSLKNPGNNEEEIATKNHSDEGKREEDAQGSGDSIKKSGVNFIKLNTTAQYKERFPRKPKPDPTKAPPNYRKGVLPKYLREKKEKEELEALSEIENQEAALKCPPGHVLISDEDRMEHLRLIRKNYNELITQLNNIPVKSDSLRTRQRKMEIENELERLENAIKLFSREKLFIKVS